MSVLKTSQNDTCSITSSGRPPDVNLNIFHKIGFSGNFSIFCDAKSIPDIAEPKYVKNLIRPILVPLWSKTSRPKECHKGTLLERCAPAGYVVCGSKKSRFIKEQEASGSLSI